MKRKAKRRERRVKQRDSGGFEAQLLCIFITPLSMQRDLEMHRHVVNENNRRDGFAETTRGAK